MGFRRPSRKGAAQGPEYPGSGAGTLAIRPGGEILGAVCENGMEAEIDNIVSTKKDNHERSGAVASVLGS